MLLASLGVAVYSCSVILWPDDRPPEQTVEQWTDDADSGWEDDSGDATGSQENERAK